MLTHRINLWSGPRNVSTALMYSFAQRADTTVVDEPLYAHYLHRSGADHPGRDAVLASQATDGEQVVREVMLGAYETPVVFFKQMTHHLDGLDHAFLPEMKHVLLIRHPKDLLLSYTQVIDQPTPEDIGFPQAVDLFDELEIGGRLAAVLETERLLRNPEGVLQQLCERLEIPFDPAMLSWPAGARPEDGVWASHWYAGVHRSTGFQPFQPKAEALPNHLEPVLHACLPAYEYLLPHALRG